MMENKKWNADQNINQGEEKLVPGTLYSSSEQMAAIMQAIDLGKKLQGDIPELGELYKSGLSAQAIVTKFDLTKYLCLGNKAALAAVTYALKGYDGSFQNARTNQYQGVLSQEEYDYHAKEHNRLSAVNVENEQSRLGKGLFSFTEEQKRKVWKESVFASGNIPYSVEEIDLIEKFAQEPKFQRGSQVNAVEIAKEVNKKFHADKEVRRARAISKLLLRIKNNEKKTRGL